jgi:hypothetical protein
MSFYFTPFPTVNYDVKKNGRFEEVTNITLRFKIQDMLRSRASLFHEHSIQDGERPDVLAFKYYDDPTLDWVIMMANLVIDPHFDWPLEYASFTNFIKEKYGSVSTAQSTVHHYEWIYQGHQVLYDGTVVPEEIYQVDLTTYNTLDATDRRIVYDYDYETDLNDAKRSIKIIDSKYITRLTQLADGIFDT